MHVHILKGGHPGGNPNQSRIATKVVVEFQCRQVKPNAGRPLATLVCSTIAVGIKEQFSPQHVGFAASDRCAWILVLVASFEGRFCLTVYVGVKAVIGTQSL